MNGGNSRHVTFNATWYLYFALKIGLSMNEALFMRFGDLKSLIACYQIDECGYDEKHRYTQTDILNM